MAYIRYKEVTKHFNFSKSINIKELPFYVLDYVNDDEILLAGYIVGRDHGFFTDKKIVLFDNSISFRPHKEITIIPYHSVSAHSVIFRGSTARIYLLLDSGYPLLLKFVNMSSTDKMRLRLIYNVMSSAICGLKPSKECMRKIIDGDFEYNKKNSRE